MMMMMRFNAWRLSATHAVKEVLVSEQCDTQSKLLAARTYHGKTYKAFLKILYDTLELREKLRTGDGEDALSPQRPDATNKRISYNIWAVEEEWVKFRTTLHSGHVPSHLTTLIQCPFFGLFPLDTRFVKGCPSGR
jgi:hypothetical protein